MMSEPFESGVAWRGGSTHSRVASRVDSRADFAGRRLFKSVNQRWERGVCGGRGGGGGGGGGDGGEKKIRREFFWFRLEVQTRRVGTSLPRGLPTTRANQAEEEEEEDGTVRGRV